MNSPTSGARPLLLLVAAFALPVVLAKLVLSQHWYTEGVTNKGQLFASPTSYQSLGAANPLPERWQILYRLPEHCDASCEDRLYLIKQSYTALGAERGRVAPVILLSRSADKAVLNDDFFVTATLPSELEPLLSDQALILVDPMGTLVMSYPRVDGREANITQGKAMLADLRKLLKLSRVG